MSQYLKLGDDQSPVQLDPHSEVGAFKVVGHCAWAKPEDKITPDFLRSRVEPWLTALFQSEHLNILIGAWICPYISRHLLSLNPLLACCRRYSRGER